MRLLLQALLWALLAICAPAHAALVCDGVTDNSAALSEPKAVLRIPAGVCRFSQTLVLTGNLVGEGQLTSQLMYCGSGDAVVIRPKGYTTGQTIRDVSIIPCNDGGGQYGLHVQLSAGSSWALFHIERVLIGYFGARGLWLDNAVGNTDGIFNGYIVGSFIGNGVLGTNVGDSLSFTDTVVHGRNNVDLSCVKGARLASFTRGQISTDAGFLMLRGCDGFRARDVWMEYQGGAVPMDSMVYVENSAGVTFEGLTVNVGNAQAAQVIALNGATDTRILNSDFVFSGPAAQVYGTSTTQRTTLTGNTYGTVKPRIVLQGS